MYNILYMLVYKVEKTTIAFIKSRVASRTKLTSFGTFGFGSKKREKLADILTLQVLTFS